MLQRGAYSIIDAPGATQTTAWDVNNLGAVVGDYIDEDGFYHGFLPGGRFTPIEFPGATHTSAQGIDDFGASLGIYIDDDEVFEVLLYGRAAMR